MSAQTKLKRNIEKTKNKIKKLTTQLQQEQEKTAQFKEKIDQLTDFARDVQKQFYDLQNEYTVKKNEFELIREEQKEKLNDELISKNLELKNLKENIEEINRETEDEILALEIYQKTIGLQCSKYNQEIQRAKGEVLKLTAELSHYENPAEASGGDLVMAKLFKQITQREKKEKLSKQIDMLTQLKDKLETEVKNLEIQLGESTGDKPSEEQPKESSNQHKEEGK